VPNSWVGSWTRTTVPSIIDSTSNNSIAVIARDKKCCVSGYQDGLERAHLCPQAEKEWFTENNMHKYNSCLDLATEYFINDQANSVSLRLDIQQCFANGDFVIVRKEGDWVAHFLRPTNQLGRIFHNRQVTVNAAVAPHFLLVHFAWAMFPFVANMLATNRNRLVRLRESDEGGEVKERDYELSGNRIVEITKKKDSRNKKRRNDGQQDAEGLAILSEVSTENTLRDSEGSTSNPMSAMDRYIAGLKRRALREQRPFNHDLICCDYDAAENAAALGLPAYLCLQCLGEELVVMPEDV
jgi:HNH endonuclease